MSKFGLLLILFPVVVPAFTEPSQQAPPQKDIDAAIEKGAKYFVNKYPKGIPGTIDEFELIVYTLIHAEVNAQNEPLKKAIDDLINLDYPPAGGSRTYRMAVRALALHSLLVKIKNSHANYRYLHEKKNDIQKKIAETAQYLVDAQLDNGQWTYGGELKNVPEISKLITGGPAPESSHNKTASKVAWENASSLTGTLYRLVPKYGADPKSKTDLGKPVQPGKQQGDNSNTQYGVLGLVAAEMSGVEVPRTSWELVVQWFEGTQKTDGGYGYGYSDPNYENYSYGSMTAAGTVALAAAYKFMGRDMKSQKPFQKAVNWLGDNFSVTRDPQRKKVSALHYFLYGVERIGALSNSKKLGSHDWYAEGATQLLKTQKADGSWKPGGWDPGHDAISVVYDTCFAILFLKRATSDMIDTGSGGIDAK